jgi:hypothetical protein
MHVMTRVDRVPHSRSQYMVVLAVVRYGCIRSAGTAHGESWASGPAGPLCRVEPACGGRLLARPTPGGRRLQWCQHARAAETGPSKSGSGVNSLCCTRRAGLSNAHGLLLPHKGLHQLSPADFLRP